MQILSTSSINSTWSTTQQYIIYEWDIISASSIAITGSNPSPINSQSAPSHRGVVDHWDPPAAVSTASNAAFLEDMVRFFGDVDLNGLNGLVLRHFLEETMPFHGFYPLT